MVLAAAAAALSLAVGAVAVQGGGTLCTSVHWAAVHKTAGVLLTAVLPTAVISAWNLSSGGPAGDTPALLASLAMLALLAGTAAWLWRARRA
ncbi:hypothetical protein [Streptomyces sp. NPDC023838]|uniref:hypothetical protein n=1 Tax=Streptomyces sp. NPDC023838 TaxID=3154325 RepID=UPI0033CD116F